MFKNIWIYLFSFRKFSSERWWECLVHIQIHLLFRWTRETIQRSFLLFTLMNLVYFTIYTSWAHLQPCCILFHSWLCFPNKFFCFSYFQVKISYINRIYYFFFYLCALLVLSICQNRSTMVIPPFRSCNLFMLEVDVRLPARSTCSVFLKFAKPIATLILYISF